MRVTITTFLLVVFGCKSFPQSNCNTVYQIVDEMPRYKTGVNDLLDDFYMLPIDKNCKREELQQVVWIIDKDGKIASVEVIGSMTKDCKTDVIEHAKTLTDWKPGRQDDKPVCDKVVLAIHTRPTK